AWQNRSWHRSRYPSSASRPRSVKAPLTERVVAGRKRVGVLTPLSLSKQILRDQKRSAERSDTGASARDSVFVGMGARPDDDVDAAATDCGKDETSVAVVQRRGPAVSAVDVGDGRDVLAGADDEPLTGPKPPAGHGSVPADGARGSVESGQISTVERALVA